MVTPIKVTSLDQPKEPFKKALFPINPFFHFRAPNAEEFIAKIKSVPREPQNDRFLCPVMRNGLARWAPWSWSVGRIIKPAI